MRPSQTKGPSATNTPLILNCPKCREAITLDPDLLAAPPGRAARLTCSACGRKNSATAFIREHDRQVAVAKKVKRDAEKAAEKAARDAHKEQVKRAEETKREQGKEKAAVARQLAREKREQQQRELAEKQHRAAEEELQRQAQLEANRALNEKDLEAIMQAVAKGVRHAYGISSDEITGDEATRVGAIFLFAGCCLGIIIGTGAESICSAIFAAMFFWFAFRARSPKRKE